jgi:mono/diheme cytochrome c family protein
VRTAGRARTLSLAGCGALFLCAALAAAVRGRLSAQTPAPGPGKAVYDAHCVECHGPSGKGDGPASFLLSPRPRDFTTAKYKIRSTDTGSIPTDDDLIRSVREGLNGTAMPGWQSILSNEEIHDVVGYVKSFSPRFTSERPQPVVLQADRPGAGGPQSVQRGAAVYERLQCAKCHGTDGRGAGAVATDFMDDWGQPLRAADLTEPWTFRGGATSRDIYLRFRTGMSGTPMPSFRDAATDADMWDLASYIVSLARKPVWQMTAAEVSRFYEEQDAEARAHPVKRGRYLADSLGCALCHSPLDANRQLIAGMKWAGGLRVRVEPFGEYPTGNLTSDRDTGLGSWTDDEIRAVLTRGVLRDGTRLLPYPMDWPSYSTMRPADLDALIAYLRTIPPIRNRVPRPSRTSLPVFLWGKFRMLILGNDPPMIFYGGNAGSPS